MRIGYFDNAARRAKFQDILRDYDPAGYRVEIQYPIRATGTIVKQMTVGGERHVATQPGALFLIHLDTPILWHKYVQDVLRGDPQKVAAVGEQLERMGCMEFNTHSGYQQIICIWAQWLHLRAIDIQKGQPLEYQEQASHTGISGVRTVLGIAQNIHKSRGGHTIVDLFLLEPLTWFRAPLAIETDHLKPEFISKFSTALTVQGIYRDWQEASPETLPPGDLTPDGNEYVFKTAIPIEQVLSICNAKVDKDSSGSTRKSSDEDILRCKLEGSLFYILPIDADHHSGVFRPMRQEHAGYILPYTASRKDIEDALSRGETDITGTWTYRGSERYPGQEEGREDE